MYNIIGLEMRLLRRRFRMPSLLLFLVMMCIVLISVKGLITDVAEYMLLAEVVLACFVLFNGISCIQVHVSRNQMRMESFFPGFSKLAIKQYYTYRRAVLQLVLLGYLLLPSVWSSLNVKYMLLFWLIAVVLMCLNNYAYFFFDFSWYFRANLLMRVMVLVLLLAYRFFELDMYGFVTHAEIWVLVLSVAVAIFTMFETIPLHNWKVMVHEQ